MTATTVLFVCVHNAGRSQMAAAFLERYGGEQVSALSAGSEPATEINAAVVEAMQEVGIDLRGRQPKLLTESAVETADVVVTMGCGDACPWFPGKRYLDWPVDDPSGGAIETVRGIRDEIDALVREFVADL